MMSSEHSVKQAVLRALDELPREKVEEVLDFVLFLKTRRPKDSAQVTAVQEPSGLLLRTLPASHLDSLTGLVAWGRDAVAAERLYEDRL
jgi:hypothetical protein